MLTLIIPNEHVLNILKEFDWVIVKDNEVTIKSNLFEEEKFLYNKILDICRDFNCTPKIKEDNAN